MVSVLLIEDELAHVELIQRAFEDRPAPMQLHVVSSISQAKAVLDPAASPHPDLVIADWLLPDGHGIEILAGSPDCPTIVMTSHGNEQVAVEAMKAGAIDYIVKSAETLADMPHIAERAMREWENIVERKRAEARITHLNAVLNAIRSVNRLITRERDPQRLVEGACQSLIKTRGYHNVWIALIDQNGRPSIGTSVIVAQPGPEEPILPLIKQASQAGGSVAALPSCVRQALQSSTVQAFDKLDAPCTSCTLLAGDITVGTLIGRMAYGERIYGVLSVAVPGELISDPEEQELFLEVLEDLAFALYSIEQEDARKRFESQFLQSQKMEAVGRLAGGIAHDFNNHLTAITGYAELLMHQLPHESTLRDDVREIVKAVERSSSLTRQLLIFSRKQSPQPMLLNLNTVVTDMHRMLQRLIREDITLKIDLGPNLGQVKVDQGQIEQVIVNLVVNARDAMPGGGELTIRTRHMHLDSKSQPLLHGTVSALPGESTDYAVLQVSDKGIGMSQEVQSHLFEPFFTTKEEGKGTGLGLATVYGIIKQSDGRVEVKSAPGQGSTFTIYLPRVSGDDSPVSHRQAASPLSGGAETILLVEDEESVRILTQRILQHNGYTVLQATHADMALAICHQYPGQIHLVISDVVMPGSISSRQMVQQMLERRPHLKVIYMSGYTDDAISEHGVLNSDTHFIQKPFNPTRLAYTVRQVLDGAKQAD